MPKISVVTVPEEILKAEEIQLSPKAKFQRSIYYNFILKTIGIIRILMDKEIMLFNIIAFFMGRLNIADNMSPFGIAMFAALYRYVGTKSTICCLWAMAGLVSNQCFTKAGIYLFVISGGLILANKVINRYNRYMMPLATASLLFIGNLTINIFNSFSLYTIVSAAIEGTMCLILSYLFIYGIPLLKKDIADNEVTNEVIANAILILALAIAGIGGLTVYGISMRNIFGGMFIMISAIKAGVGISTAVGTAVGLVIGLSDGNAPVNIGIFSVAGLIAGIFRDMGKLAVNIGYFLGCTVAVLYIGVKPEFTSVFAEAGIASLLTVFVPRRALNSFGNLIGIQSCQSLHYENWTSTVTGRIENIADVFGELSNNIIKALGETVTQPDKNMTSLVLNSVARVCENCDKRDVCWDKNFYKTYQNVIDIYGSLQRNNSKNSISNAFGESCIRKHDVVEAIKSAAITSQLGSYWQKKAMESEQVLGEQLRALSGILKNLTYDLTLLPPSDQQLAYSIKSKAAMLDCSLKQVIVSGVGSNKAICITKKVCSGNRECKNTILPLAANLAGEKLMLKAECGRDNKDCRLTLTTASKYKIKIGSANLSKDKIANGDSYAVIPVTGGKVALLISDGMGTGSKAKGESSSAVYFMERLLIAGFDINLAVKMVNSLLLIRKREESFATMDMTVVDSYSGDAEFLKISAAPTFIKRVGEVFTVNTSSLPIGIVEQIEINPVKMHLSTGDIIVMVSDGVADCVNCGDNEPWLVNYLRRISFTDPQHIADDILDQAKRLAAHSKRKDDMTVLVARIMDIE